VRTLEQILQQLLGRKVFVAERRDQWARPSEFSGVDRNPSTALRVACGDGLRPPLAEAGRESPGQQLSGTRKHGHDLDWMCAY
jgi:hypothetical protein